MITLAFNVWLTKFLEKNPSIEIETLVKTLRKKNNILYVKLTSDGKREFGVSNNSKTVYEVIDIQGMSYIRLQNKGNYSDISSERTKIILKTIEDWEIYNEIKQKEFEEAKKYLRFAKELKDKKIKDVIFSSRILDIYSSYKEIKAGNLENALKILEKI